jgi:hypothetical protein
MQDRDTIKTTMKHKESLVPYKSKPCNRVLLPPPNATLSELYHRSKRELHGKYKYDVGGYTEEYRRIWKQLRLSF